MLETILFLSLSLLAIASAIGMVLHKNPVYSVLLLILTLFSVAGFYVLLNAPFIAAVHMIVYAGAIMVLFLFVIMLLDVREEGDRLSLRKFSRIVGVIAAAVFLVETVLLFTMTFKDSSSEISLKSDAAQQIGDTGTIGKVLFSDYILAFEIASVLLLAAIIGAVILARRIPGEQNA